MIILVIPDVHLKPWIFQRASELMREIKADRAVCLMDIADDWKQQLKQPPAHSRDFSRELAGFYGQNN